MRKLKRAFFLQSDVVLISRKLLGKYLFSCLDGKQTTGGIIVETEAYAGVEDRASHAYNNRRTKRTEVMYQKGGIAYVYLCYGMHSLFNIITNIEGIPHAVLIRAIQPTHGIKTMLKRRNKKTLDYTVAAGPGALTKALGINTTHNGMSLSSPSAGNRMWLEDRGYNLSSKDIYAAPRIGVDYAGADAKRLWRFWIRNSPWVSSAK